MTNLDLTKLGPDFRATIFFFEGRQDPFCRPSLVWEYNKTIRAPRSNSSGLRMRAISRSLIRVKNSQINCLSGFRPSLRLAGMGISFSKVSNGMWSRTLFRPVTSAKSGLCHGCKQRMTATQRLAFQYEDGRKKAQRTRCGQPLPLARTGAKSEKGRPDIVLQVAQDGYAVRISTPGVPGGPGGGPLRALQPEPYPEGS